MVWTEQSIFFVDFEGSRASGILEFGVAEVCGGRIGATSTRLCAATGTPLHRYFSDPSYWPCVAPGTSDGSVYFTENNGPHQNRDFWDRCTENRLIKVKDGKVEWMVGAHDGTLAHDGFHHVVRNNRGAKVDGNGFQPVFEHGTLSFSRLCIGEM